MRIFRNQTLATSLLDSQGERLTKDFLERACARMSGKRMPVHQQHDMLKPVAGYIENVRLEECTKHAGEWRLVGDVHVDTGSVQDILGGFSISGMEMIREASQPTALAYIPFPHYNDAELLAELLADSDLNVGKWIKKELSPAEWVVIGSVFTFVARPVWDDIYKRKIAPRLDELVSRLLPKLRRKGLAVELAQIVLVGDAEVEVRMIPIRGQEERCLISAKVEPGLKLVVAFLLSDEKARSAGVNRVVIFFDAGGDGYRLHRIEYSDGVILHVA